VRSGEHGAAFDGAPRITMQCIDCHNRAAHIFLSPDQSLDGAFTLGLLPTSLPFLKQVGVELLSASYETSAQAAAQIPQKLVEWYRENRAQVLAERTAEVEAAGAVLARLYARSVFPEYAVRWDTYADHGGHSDESPGCFRCHGGEHATSTGETITKNCFKCHTASAVGETAPAILRSLGLERPLKDMEQGAEKT
jgi:hypothetical protein